MTRRDTLLIPAAATAAWAQSAQATTELRLADEAAAITDRAIREIASKAEWERHRAQRLREMRDMLGLDPWPARTPLNVRVRGTIDKGDYLIERIAFESMPRFYVTGNLYRPKKQEAARVPAIVYVCGHAYTPQGAKVHYQPHGISFAKNGYVCLILDPIQLAEIFALHHGVSFLSQFEWYARGYTPAGPEVWNAMRAIDYLTARPEVDAAKIGMTGRSGGAAMTWFTAAVDERVKVAAPVMGISTYRANLPLNTQRLHCDCMFAINTARHDMIHQGALIAPRPLLMAHGIKDDLFPVPGYKEFEKHVGGLYESYDRREAFTNVEVDSGHQDSEFLRGRVIEWMDRHLWQRPARKLDLAFEKEEGANLAVYDGASPKDAVNYRVQDAFTRRPAQPMPWVQRAKRLREIVHSIGIDQSAVPETAGVRAKPEDAPRLLYIASPGDDATSLAWLFRTLTANTTQVTRLVVYPRGATWSAAIHRDMERNAMHVGWSVDSMRLSDVLAALKKLKAIPGGNVSVMGRGVAAGLALYASILDPDVHQAILMEPPASHTHGPFFLNILRETDLPEVAALMAPRRLSFVASALPEPYSLTKRLFTQMGVTDHLYAGVNLDGIVTGRYGHGYGSGY